MTEYVSHPEYRSLLENVRTNPADDAPRWIIADWIQDAGDEARAEAIREELRTGAGRWINPAKPLRLADGTVIHGKQRRGFLEEIHLPCETFLRHAAELFEGHPITVVELLDKFPVPDTLIGLYKRDPETADEEIMSDDVPGELWELLPESWRGVGDSSWKFWHTTEEATLAISQACVAFGRRRAGLPPLGGSFPV